ncbi:MAG TPA: TauD/TfdA family dioxygenase [Steroidobacteraceae bacterium]|nr:TauD/TfdA family dioxygenase [Steroidobacteraceae bacterium]
MTHVTITKANELAIEDHGGRPLAIHPLWLRERSREARVYDAHTAQRLYDPSDLDLQLTITELSEPRPGYYQVRFSDGHAAMFSAQQILAEAAMAACPDDVPAVQLWDGGFKLPPRTPWTRSPTNAQLAAWLEEFLRLGFIVFTDVPTQPGTVLEVAAAFGFTRVTNFGALFDVRSTPQATDLAYTSLPLDPHTDNPYRNPVPGVQLLHCLVNETSGGLSTLVDGFAAAEYLRAHDAPSFDELTRTPVQFRYRDAHTELTASAPLIELDKGGTVRAVHFSPRLDYVPLRAPADLARFYRARRALDRLLRSTERELRFLLDEGDLMMMDNQRLLHGRTGFDPAEGRRHLQGCYIDIDAPRSTYRVLRRGGLPEAPAATPAASPAATAREAHA